jgi:hypothetical protein
MENQEETVNPSTPETQQPSDNTNQSSEPQNQKRKVNEVEDLKAIKEGKLEGDKQFQIEKKQALRIYQKTFDLIKEIKQDYEGDKNSEFFKAVLDHEIKISSNLALTNSKLNNFEKAIDFDLAVLT